MNVHNKTTKETIHTVKNDTDMYLIFSPIPFKNVQPSKIKLILPDTIAVTILATPIDSFSLYLILFVCFCDYVNVTHFS